VPKSRRHLGNEMPDTQKQTRKERYWGHWHGDFQQNTPVIRAHELSLEFVSKLNHELSLEFVSKLNHELSRQQGTK